MFGKMGSVCSPTTLRQKVEDQATGLERSRDESYGTALVKQLVD